MKLLTIFALLLTFSSFGQSTITDTLTTSAECGLCKERIEGKLNYTKGIKFAELDYESRELIVKYSSKHISLDKIKQLLSDLGYDADEVKADPMAQKALPLCCQPGGMKGEEH